MLINLRGHVESDPMAVPAPARMDTGSDDSFEQMLQQTVAAEPEQREEPPVERAEAQDEPAPRSDELPAEQPVADVPQQHGDEIAPEITNTMHLEAAPEDDGIRAAGSGRQDTAGKGTDSPRTSSTAWSPGAEPLLAAFLQQGGNQQRTPFVVAGEANAIGAVGAARGAGEGQTRGIGGQLQRGSAVLQAPAVAASYRTSGATSAQLLDQARDSVFKQILLQLQPEGGEMRVRLQPPDLGELDVRLVVEDGNKLSLTLSAERSDLNELLQRHLDELKQSLQQAGLEVTSASVQTRGEFERGQQRDSGRRDDGAFAGESEPTNDFQPRFGGQLSATGLDFWA